MTTLTDIRAITMTPTAKAAGFAKGLDLQGLHSQAALHASGLQVVLKQIIALHPVGGGDAANLASLNAILAALA